MSLTEHLLNKVNGRLTQLDEIAPKKISINSVNHPLHKDRAAVRAANPGVHDSEPKRKRYESPYKEKGYEKDISNQDAFKTVAKQGIGEVDHIVYSHHKTVMHKGKPVAARHIGTYHAISNEDMGMDDDGSGDKEEIFHHIVHRDADNPRKLHVYQTSAHKNWHGIDESVELQEETNLHELSNATIRKALSNAIERQKDMLKKGDYTNAVKKGKQAVFVASKTKLKEDIEQLDELSKETLTSYKKKAAFDVRSANSTIGSFDKSESEKNKAAETRNKRFKGWARADRKLRNEEVELEEDYDKGSQAHSVDLIKKDFPKHFNGKNVSVVSHPMNSMHHLIIDHDTHNVGSVDHSVAHGPFGPDIESPSAFMNKKDREEHYMKNMMRYTPHKIPAPKLPAVKKKRERGFQDAAATGNPRHFAKEEVELDESKKKIGEYSHTNGHSTKVYHLTGEHDEGDPYHVKLFRNGKHYEPADYFTNDKDDAHHTAQHMVKEGVGLEEATTPRAGFDAAAHTKKLLAHPLFVSNNLSYGIKAAQKRRAKGTYDSVLGEKAGANLSKLGDDRLGTKLNAAEHREVGKHLARHIESQLKESSMLPMMFSLVEQKLKV